MAAAFCGPGSPRAAVDVDEYVAHRTRLLKLERDAEVAEDVAVSSDACRLASLEASGSAILRLSLAGQSLDTGGRTTLKFATRGGRVLTAVRMSTGDLVGVRASQRNAKTSSSKASGASNSMFARGVLSLLGDTAIEVVMDDADLPPEFSLHASPPGNFSIVRMGSSVTYDRCMTALEDVGAAASSSTHPAHALVGVLFGGVEPRFEDSASLVLSPAQERALASLNESQRAAVLHALRSKDLCVVHGPPGTGKTSTLVAYIAAEILRGSRLLVVAPSNVAVDNIAEKLAALDGELKVKFVRTGHPARVMPSIAGHTLDAVLSQTDEAALARDVRAELAELQNHRPSSKHRDRAFVRSERKALRKELRKRESDALKRLMARVDCVLSTAAGAAGKAIDCAVAAGPFDVVVVDEAGQASEPAALVALLRGKRAVLAGDPFQLAPTVKSPAAEKEGLSKTLLDRVFESDVLRRQVVKMLLCQYRMNKVISNWSSDALYDGRIASSSHVAEHLLLDLALERDGDGGDANGNLNEAFVVLDTAGCDMAEAGDDIADADDPLALSKMNEGEALLVVQHVSDLLGSGLKPSQVGVISPYMGQVSLLRSKFGTGLLRDGLEVSTVDSFQGREKEAIVISLVRCNDRGILGFVSDKRRLNVAITRARRHVCIICDSTTVSRDAFISAMLDYASEHGEYRSAEKFVSDTAVSASASSQFLDDGEVVTSLKGGEVDTSVPEETLSCKPRRSGNSEAPPKKHRKPKPSGPSRNEKLRKNVKSSVRAPDNGQMLHDIEEQILAFSKDASAAELKFPTSLSSFQRKIAHEVCEKLGLLHETQGEGDARFITVSKPSRKSLTAQGPVDRQAESPDVDVDTCLRTSPVGIDTRRHFGILEDYSVEESAALAGKPTPTVSLAGQDLSLLQAGNRFETSSKPEAPSVNELLKQANAERLRRQAASLSSGGPAAQKQASPDSQICTGESHAKQNLPPATRRIIVDGRLLDGARADDVGATSAARSRLKSRLAKHADARKPKKK